MPPCHNILCHKAPLSVCLYGVRLVFRASSFILTIFWSCQFAPAFSCTSTNVSWEAVVMRSLFSYRLLFIHLTSPNSFMSKRVVNCLPLIGRQRVLSNNVWNLVLMKCLFYLCFTIVLIIVIFCFVSCTCCVAIQQFYSGNWFLLLFILFYYNQL